MQLQWVADLVAEVPKGWEPELDPKGGDDKVLDVPADLLQAYRAGMWAISERNRINREHLDAHERADEEMRDMDASECDRVREQMSSLKHRGTLVQEVVRVELRHRLGLKEDDSVILTQEGMVLEAPPLPDPFTDFLSSLGGGRISLIRL